MKTIISGVRLLIIGLLIMAGMKADASNYYWVGGTGNWSDFAHHWATTSGGNSFQTQVPQSLDNVFFDANSFTSSGQTVTIDQTIENCNNMNWTGVTNNPTLTGPYSNELFVYGSLTLVSAMSLTFNGEVDFEATSTGQTITTASKQFFAIIFDGIGGGWTLQDSLSVSYFIQLNNGTFSTNNNNITCGYIQSYGSNTRALNFGSSLITVTNGGSGWNVSATNFAFNAGTSTMLFPSGGYFTGTTLTYYNVTFLTGCELYSTSAAFNNLSIGGGGTLSGSFTAYNLTLSGSPFTLSSTITITDSLNINGTCGALVYLYSGSTTSTATISKSSGTVNVNYVYLQGIAASGGATFMANNSINGGNNSGWIINQLSSRNLYWVNNSGNWSDGTHWSLTSGGTGSGCAPTPIDNIFFDTNSFSSTGQTVTVDPVYAYCNNMDWTGASNGPTFSSTSNHIMEIFGSLTLAAGMTYDFIGPILFEATSTGKTITSAGNVFRRTLYFTGVGGGWTLQDSLSSTDELNLEYGTLNTNNQNVRCYDFASTYFNNVRGLNLGSSVVTITNAGPGVSPWDIYTTGLTFNAGTSTIVIEYNSGCYFMGGNLTYYNLFFTGANGNGSIDGDTFNDVYFAGNGTLQGACIFNNLTLSAGKSYTLYSGITQTIVDTMNAIGNCSNPIYIESYTAGSQATISKSSGTITVDYVYLKDIKATGGAVFTADDATDGGDNTGWTINTSTAKNYYWVGGTGNWSDGSHWSLSSGGAGSGCIPGPPDNVFFDANSFSGTGETVTIDLNPAYCATMDWTGANYNPSLSMSYANNLEIYGSLKFIPAMSVYLGSTVSFEATDTGNTITSATQKFGNIQFTGTGGSWTLQDTLNCTYMGLIHGTLNTNNQNIRSGEIQTSTLNSNCTFNMGSSVITITGGNNSWFSENSITINAGTSHLIFTENTGNTNYFAAASQTFYDVTFLGPNTPAQIQEGANTFHNLEFYCDADIPNNQTCSSLFFYNPGHTVSVGAGKTITISDTGQLIATGSAGFPIRIESEVASSQFTFLKTAGLVCLDYIRLSDSKATGGASFNAGVHSQDLGDNTGWNFSGGSGGNSAISISSSETGTICSGTSVTFTATPTGNGSPTFDWQVNGVSEQNDTSLTYTTSSLSGNDVIECIMTSGSNCTSQLADTSNSIDITATTSVTASISISTPATTVCAATAVSFTASATNGGTNPFYQWMKNGNKVGTNSATYTDSSLSNNDTIICQLTSNASCVTDTNTLSNSIIMKVIAKANAGNISAVPDTICAGASAVLTAAGTTGGIQWQSSQTGNNFTNIPGADTISYLIQPQQSSYFRIVAGSGSCADTSVAFKVTVNPSPAAPTLSSNDSSICSYDSILINSSGIYSSYLWSNGDTRSYTYANQTGGYSVTVTDANGCTAVSDPQNIVVFPITPTPVLSTNDSITCSNDSTEITSSGAYSSYIWSNGDTRNYTYANAAAAYSLTVTDANGCTAASARQNISVYPVSSVSIIVQGDTLTSFGETGYQWYRNDSIIPGATSAIYIVNETGYYSVDVTDTNGCKASSSQTYIDITAISALEEGGLLAIYPAPFTNTVFIKEDETGTVIRNIKVYDVLGKMVLNNAYNNAGPIIFPLDLSALPQGVYYIRVETNQSGYIRSVIKN